MKVREIKENELSDLLELYTHLHELGVPENSEHLQNTWAAICRISVRMHLSKMLLPTPITEERVTQPPV